MPDVPLSLQTYQTEAQKTDRTRGSKGQEFLLLGLFGESGTLMDEVKKKQRDTRSYVGYERSVVEELGDVLWSLSNIADRAGLSLSAIARNAMQQQFSSFNDVGTTLNFSTIQPQQHLPLNAPTPAFERTLMRLVSGIGNLAAAQSAGQLNAQTLGPGLSEIFSALVQASTEAGVTLELAALQNLKKTFDRWPTDPKPHGLFDDGYSLEERLPRKMTIDIYEQIRNQGTPNQKEYVLQRSNNIFIGDRVTDNILDPDDYRFHDVFHYAYAAILGWSPVIRALLRLKRKSNTKVDETQDGARAVLIEEGVSTFVFAYAKHLDLFEGQEPGDLSFTLLKRVKEFVDGYEVAECPMWQWEKAILDGYKGFRFLKRHRRGRLVIDLEARSIDIAPMPELSA
jgi:NTP pyrophosphatase (non-canonical NTP hydrolase)